MKPVLSGFAQLAYVTNDLDRATEYFKENYGIPSFHHIDSHFPARVGETDGEFTMKIALANVPGVQIELIEPVADIAGFYSSALNGKADFAVALHHVCQKLDGDLSNWDAHFADLETSGRTIICHADPGASVRLVFTDDRAILGAYVEHLWMTPEAWREIERPIPFHAPSR